MKEEPENSENDNLDDIFTASDWRILLFGPLHQGRFVGLGKEGDAVSRLVCLFRGWHLHSVEVALQHIIRPA